MFRLVNRTKNISNKPNGTILNSITINHFCFLTLQLRSFVYQLRDSPYQNTNSYYQLRNSAFHLRKTDHQLGKHDSQSAKTGSQSGKYAYQCRKTASQLRKTASQWRKSGHHFEKSVSGNIIQIVFSIWSADILRRWQSILITNKIQLLTLKILEL
jgi:hypothetical protein